jgi:hypothetical protein
MGPLFRWLTGTSRFDGGLFKRDARLSGRPGLNGMTNRFTILPEFWLRAGGVFLAGSAPGFVAPRAVAKEIAYCSAEAFGPSSLSDLDFEG